MERKPVKSSNVKSFGYEPSAKVLEVEFHGSKTKAATIYHLHGVPHSEVLEFEKAPSKGKFYAERLRGKYRTERIK